jgi:hypothetical protein
LLKNIVILDGRGIVALVERSKKADINTQVSDGEPGWRQYYVASSAVMVRRNARRDA